MSEEKDNPLVRSIAMHLDDWEAKDLREWAGDLVHKETGARIFIRTSGHSKKGMGYACVSFPRDHQGSAMSAADWGFKELTTSINFSLDKDTAQIAKDIYRRLIPNYLPAYLVAVAKLKQRVARQDRDKAIAESLAYQLGTEPNSSSDGREFSQYNSDGIYYKGRVSDEKVHLELSDLTLSQATAILDFCTSKRGRKAV